MKLLIFIHSLFSGGAERVAVNLANNFNRQGWEITITTLSSIHEDFFQLDTGVKRIALNHAGVSHNGFDALMGNARRVVALRRELLVEQPDVALAMMNTACVLLTLASFGLPIRCIGAERNQPSMSPLGAAWSFLRRLTYRHLDALVALTPEGAQWLGAHTGARRVTVIPNPVVWPLPENLPRVNPDSVGERSRKRLLAVGRLVRVKGFDRLLDAYALLMQRHPDWELVVIGDGIERDALQHRIDATGMAGKAILAGQVGNLTDWYQSAHLFVMSSHHEGFPNTLLEAMAHGLPVVSFDCEAGPRNIIRHETDGLLAPADDLAALTAALDRMMCDAALRDRLAARAREVRERFSEARIQVLWQQLIHEVLNSHGR